MLPVVAIVGRPNVGKSTLFNRLTKTRDAIMSSYPGTTRDRQYGTVKEEDRQFIVVDTGGIAEETNEMTSLITQQALQAIQDADKIVFVIDAKSGILPLDRNIAHLLRRSGKPIILAINKTDGLNPAAYLHEAYELGMGEAIPIAAVHGTGMTTLIETLFPTPHPFIPSAETQPIKLAIVGRPNVGKSTLTNRMLGEERLIVHDAPGTTRDSIFIPLERLGQHYILIDTAGVRKRKKVTDVPEKFSVVKTLQSIEEANVVLYVIDANLGVSEQDMKLLGFILECGKGLVLAVNKWDGLSEETRDHARATIDRHLEFVRFARLHFISALHGSGVGNLFGSIDEAYRSATKKLGTPELTRLLQQAIAAHSPPLVKGRRIKLRYAHSGGHNPQRVIIHGNQLESLPESYRRFLSHYFQTKLDLYGTPIYIEYKISKNPYARVRKK